MRRVFQPAAIGVVLVTLVSIVLIATTLRAQSKPTTAIPARTRAPRRPTVCPLCRSGDIEIVANIPAILLCNVGSARRRLRSRPRYPPASPSSGAIARVRPNHGKCATVHRSRTHLDTRPFRSWDSCIQSGNASELAPPVVHRPAMRIRLYLPAVLS